METPIRLTADQNQDSPGDLVAESSIADEPILAELDVDEPILAELADDGESSITEKAGLIRRAFRGSVWLIRTSFCFASLTALLAVLTAIPVLQFIAFGYLLDVAGRLAQGNTLRKSVPNLDRAGKIGLAWLALFIVSLLPKYLVTLESISQLINPGSEQAAGLRFAAVASSMLAIAYLMWAWVRRGQLRHYFWPQPIRFLKEGWRWSTWKDAPDQLWDFTVSLELPRLFWLGVRGALATIVWLVPGMIMIAANRQGKTGLAGLVGALALFAMGIVLLYLPMLQVNFAAENKFKAMFDVRRVRSDFRRAPWAWLLAMTCGLLILPIPLYLLKVQAIPREVAWLPCLVFIAFILPARIAEGLALRRARRRTEDPTGRWATISRVSARLLMLVVVGTYLAFLTISQFTSWDGLATWVEQHAVLLPRPFVLGI